MKKRKQKLINLGTAKDNTVYYYTGSLGKCASGDISAKYFVVSCVFRNTLKIKCLAFTLQGPSDPIPVFSSHMAQVGYDPRTCK